MDSECLILDIVYVVTYSKGTFSVHSSSGILHGCLLGQIDSYIEEASTPYVVVSGDFNANFRNDKNTFRNTNLGISGVAHNCDSNRFKFYSDAQGTFSWLDHIITTQSASNLISSVYVLYDYIGSDHFPICCDLDVKVSSSTQGSNKSPAGQRTAAVPWSKIL